MPLLALLGMGLSACNMASIMGYGEGENPQPSVPSTPTTPDTPPTPSGVDGAGFEDKTYDDKISGNGFTDNTKHATAGVKDFPQSGDGYYRAENVTPFTYRDINYSAGMDNIVSAAAEERHILVIPVEIENYPFASTFRQELYDTLNGEGIKTSNYWESLSSFYYKSSYGKLNLKFDITPTYACGYTAKQLVRINDQGTSGADASIQVVDEAVEAYRTKFGNASLKKYDSDANGYLDGVIAIYSCHNSNEDATIGRADPNGEVFWAYCYWTDQEPNVTKPAPSLYFWASYDFLSETNASKKDAHTLIHEFGHMLGLDDYYAGEDVDVDAAGGSIMMDYNIKDHDIWSKMALGWTTPYVVTGDCTISINPSTVNGDCILVPAGSFNGTAYDEFLLLELYTPTDLNYLDSVTRYSGRVKGMTTFGVRMWHIDARLIRTSLYGTSTKWSYWTEKNPTELDDENYAYQVAASNCFKDAERANVNYSLISLIDAAKKKDFKQTSTGSHLADNSCLFETGNTFAPADYSKYFVNSKKTGKPTFNNNQSINVNMRFDEVSETKATISFSF